MEIIIAISFLVGAGLIGFFIGTFSEKYRLKVMLSLSRKTFDDLPCWERLEKILITWRSMRQLFYIHRGGLSGNEYFAMVTLMAEMDEYLDFDNIRETPATSEE